MFYRENRHGRAGKQSRTNEQLDQTAGRLKVSLTSGARLEKARKSVERVHQLNQRTRSIKRETALLGLVGRGQKCCRGKNTKARRSESWQGQSMMRGPRTGGERAQISTDRP